MDYLKTLEEKLGYEFKDREYLKLALTHSSYGNEVMLKTAHGKNNERLEFLGDAVLELVSSEFLYTEYSHIPEGELSKLRASLVSEAPLADCARTIELDKYILLGRGEKQNHGEQRDSILSDAYEAVIGAIYLDGGIDEAKKFVRRYVLADIEHKKRFYDAKTELQVIVQERFQCTPEYVVINESGPAHEKEFTLSCRIKGEEYGVGVGRSKKAAQQQAAYMAIMKLEEE